MKCDYCALRSYENIVKILSILAGVGSAYALSLGLLTDPAINIAAYVALGIAIAVGIAGLIYLFTTCRRNKAVNNCLCQFGPSVAIAAAGTIITAIVAIVAVFVITSVVSLIAFALLAMFFVAMLLYIVLLSICIFCNLCHHEHDDDCTKSSGCF